MPTSSSNQSGAFNSTENSGTTGTQTSTVADPFGLASLVGSQGQAAAGTDAARTSYLMNLLQNGPTQLQGQTSQAVNNALSGPGMFGAGDNARARAAGDAASGVGLNDLNSVLSASSQLAGPTAVQTAAASALPYAAQTTNQDANTTATSSGNSGSSGTVTQPSAGMCCFIFLESYNGKLPWYVRACRDEFQTPARRRGYVRMSKAIVPAMRISAMARFLVNFGMVIPLSHYGRWYKEGKGHGYLAKPLLSLWLNIWELLGKEE